MDIILTTMILFIPCYLVAGIIDKIGHVLGGILQGFKLYTLVVGPFGLKRNDDDKIVFYFERNYMF